MNLLQRFSNHIKEKKLLSKEDNLLITVSGGLDSIVLSHLCKQSGFTFSIAHCNFGLREEESDRDEAFVRSFAQDLQVPIHVKHFDTKLFAEENKLSIQVAARELRYNWFYELVKDQKLKESTAQAEFTIHHSPFTLIATAHHQDDNIETVLINLFKGTGISGLHGILPQTNKLVRPLLFATRAEIEVYANEHNLTWVEDSSNSQIKYTRNYFRHELIPAIEKVFPTAKENLSRSIEHFTEAEVLYNQALGIQKKKLMEHKGNEVWMPVLKLQRATPLNTLLYEILKGFGFTGNQVEEVKKLLASESGKYILSSTHRILRNRAWLIVSPIYLNESSIHIIEKDFTKQILEIGELLLDKIPANNIHINNDSSIAYLDSKDIQFPLLLRKWKDGDYFYPLGMQKKKKLARFFIDQKLSQLQKEKVWVLESNKRIIWVIGYRIDNRFKINPSTKEVLRITVKSNT